MAEKIEESGGRLARGLAIAALGSAAAFGALLGFVHEDLKIDKTLQAASAVNGSDAYRRGALNQLVADQKLVERNLEIGALTSLLASGGFAALSLASRRETAAGHVSVRAASSESSS